MLLNVYIKVTAASTKIKGGNRFCTSINEPLPFINYSKLSKFSSMLFMSFCMDSSINSKSEILSSTIPSVVTRSVTLCKSTTSTFSRLVTWVPSRLVMPSNTINWSSCWFVISTRTTSKKDKNRFIKNSQIIRIVQQNSVFTIIVLPWWITWFKVIVYFMAG